ncbi:MAG: Hsp33 family molecular chaperone HslO [Kiritimatiellae bacterium]|nr:Hsp33 family molecular chaperone HslO [Kiritimatiellia bacterium]
MIAQKNADYRQVIRSKTSRITLTYVQVSDSARELEQCHLCGPTAGLVQAEALAGVALLGAELDSERETVTLRLDTDGPIGGLLVEANGHGDLRGYTKVKVMNAFDGLTDPDLDQVMGGHGTVEIIRSLPGALLSSARSEVNPPSVTQALQTYYATSLQRSAAIQLAAIDTAGYIDTARGLLLERMPDSDAAAFEQAKLAFTNKTVQSFLLSNVPLADICTLLKMGDPVFSEPFPLRFACHCSAEKVEMMLTCLSIPELKQMVRENHPIEVYCHLCGKGYSIDVNRLNAVLRKKLKTK